MKRLVGMAAAALIAPAIGASMATTAAASGAIPTIVTPGSHWTVTSPVPSCENLHFLASHKFVADEFSDAGTWKEPTHSTIAITWTSGESQGLRFSGAFNAGAGTYSGHYTSTTGQKLAGKLIPGTKSGC